MLKLCYSNLIDATGTTITSSTEATALPDDNIQHFWKTKTWRTSGGNFVVTINANDDIDFEETNGVELTATLAAGTYTAATLIAEMETRLEAAGASGYAVSYSSSTHKFTIVSDGAGGGGIFKLRWNSGSNAATTVGGTIGFDTAADDSGSLTYTSDNVSIHSEEWIKFDFGLAQNVTEFLMTRHGVSSSATVKIQGNATDSWASPTVDVTLTYNIEIMLNRWSVNQSYRYWRILIIDTNNSNGYVEIGRAFLGTSIAPERNFTNGYRIETVDPSKVETSSGGVESTDEETPYLVFSLPFENTLIDNVEIVRKDRGKTGDLFICCDYDNELLTDGKHDYSRYVRFLSLPNYSGSHLKRKNFSLDFKELV